jgi:hypothetical protein
MDFIFDIPLFEDIFDTVQDLFGSTIIMGVALWLFLIVFAAAAYIYSGYTLQCIGKKAGLGDEWMPFVPFARTVYRLRIVKEQWWKMFFLEYEFVYASLFSFLMFAIFGAKTPFTFIAVLLIFYVLACLAYRMLYSYKFFQLFGFNPFLALIVLVPGVNATVFLVTDCLIAYSNNFGVGGIAGSGQGPALGGGGQFSGAPGGQGGQGGPRQQAPAQGGFAPQPASYAPSGGGSGGSISGVAGVYVNQTFDLRPGEELIMGRDASHSHIIFEQSEEKVSRKHCGVQFDPRNQCYIVTDYSSNGTFLGTGAQLAPMVQTQLPRGTVVALGNRQNQFRLN